MGVCVCGGRLTLPKQGLWLGPLFLCPCPAPPSAGTVVGPMAQAFQAQPRLPPALPSPSTLPLPLPWAGATAKLNSCQGRAASPAAAREARAQSPASSPPWAGEPLDPSSLIFQLEASVCRPAPLQVAQDRGKRMVEVSWPRPWGGVEEGEGCLGVREGSPDTRPPEPA